MRSPAPRRGTAAWGWGRGRARTGRNSGSPEWPARGPVRGAAPAQGPRGHPQRGMGAPSREAARVYKGKTPRLKACMVACTAEERTGTRDRRISRHLPRECSRRVTTGTAAGQTPPCRNSDISQAASNSKSCINNLKKLKSGS